jgi:hypothetical protein
MEEEMILTEDKNKSIYACNAEKKEAYKIGSRTVWYYDPYTKSIGLIKEQFENYTFELSFHSFDSYYVSRCRSTYANQDNSILVLEY